VKGPGSRSPLRSQPRSSRWKGTLNPGLRFPLIDLSPTAHCCVGTCSQGTEDEDTDRTDEIFFKTTSKRLIAHADPLSAGIGEGQVHIPLPSEVCNTGMALTIHIRRFEIRYQLPLAFILPCQSQCHFLFERLILLYLRRGRHLPRPQRVRLPNHREFPKIRDLLLKANICFQRVRKGTQNACIVGYRISQF
jgi:hypothetical protein